MSLLRQAISKLSHWSRRFTWVDELDKKCVFITGCDTGFGYELAKSLCGYGMHVYAGCYTNSSCDKLRQELGSKNIRPIRVDVTDSASVQRAADYIKGTLPKDTEFWAIVNNAGILGNILPVEFLTKEDFKEVFDVNVFGMVDVTNAFLPLLKRSKGRIVNMASIGGIVSLPNWTPYISSKHAAKGYSDSLRLEKDVWGIKVSTIQPGFMKTDLFRTGAMDERSNARWGSLPASTRSEYGEKYMEECQEWTHQMLQRESSTYIETVISAYEHAILSKRPRGVYYPGFSAKYILGIHLLPRIVWDKYILKMFTVLPKATQKQN